VTVCTPPLLPLLLPPLELLLLELLELELLLLELLLLLLLELLLSLGVLLPPPHATTMKLAQTARVSARTEATFRCRERIEYICSSLPVRPFSGKRVARNQRVKAARLSTRRLIQGFPDNRIASCAASILKPTRRSSDGYRNSG
jgi:hypothetical protein